MSDKKYKTVSSKIVHKNPYFSVKEDDVIEPDDRSGRYFVVTKNPGVFIVAQNDSDEIILIQQSRYFTGTESYELPAGGTDGEPSLVAAKRELQEETGFIADSWTHVSKLFSANGISDQTHDIYLAAKLNQTNKHEKDEEGITEVDFFRLDTIKRMIKNGEITDMQSIGALYVAINYLEE